MQVLNFAVKLALRQPEDTRVESLAKYVLEMARFDLSHDLRDRARFMTAMLGLATADEGVDEAALLALNAKAGEVRVLRRLHVKVKVEGAWLAEMKSGRLTPSTAVVVVQAGHLLFCRRSVLSVLSCSLLFGSGSRVRVAAVEWFFWYSSVLCWMY